MFTGTTTPKLDDKGRLVIPSKFRELTEGPIYVTKGHENCLSIYTASEFVRMAEQLQSARVSTKSARQFVRSIMSSAELQMPDKQGRISIPANLRAYAELDRDLVVIGINNRVEIWSAKLWDESEAERDELFSNRDEEVIPGVF